MAEVNARDRTSLERVYPPEAFAHDAAQNEKSPSAILHGVRIGSAPDQQGCFEIERARRHVGEPETPYFLAPARRAEALTGQEQSPSPSTAGEQDSGYAQFLEDILAAAERVGFRENESPGMGEVRLRGLRQ